MKVGFLNNQIDNRGTGNALYAYAHYNEIILGNKSIIVTLTKENAHYGMYNKLIARFGSVQTIWNLISSNESIDVLYHIKSGEKDGEIIIPGTRYVVHAVFNPTQPHGDRYATISEWMGAKYNVPYVPHIIDTVEISQPIEKFRLDLGIPNSAFVYGRHGGYDSFDINWAWESINRALVLNSNIYFVFLNTKIPDLKFEDNSRVIFLEDTVNDYKKALFINSCDIMLHARARGETFGIAVGEFAVANKRVLTFSDSPEKAHLLSLGNLGITYSNVDELTYLLSVLPRIPKTTEKSKYDYYLPTTVMNSFKEVFLDG